MSRAIDDLEIGPSVRSFYSVVLDVQMFVVLTGDYEVFSSK